MTAWEYATVDVRSEPQQDPKDQKLWTWLTTYELWINGVLVAQWSSHAPPGGTQSPGDESRSATPHEANQPPWGKETNDLYSLVGREGWELVSEVVTKTALWVGVKIGDWETSSSTPMATRSTFKRPAA